MNNPAYSGSGIPPPTNVPAHTRSILTRRVSASALLSVVLLVAGHPQVSALTYRVPSEYTTIQGAVTAAASHSTVPVTIEVDAGGTYREVVAATQQHRTGSTPLVLRALGTVTVDGSADLTGATWTQYQSSQVWSTGVSFSGGTAANQLFINGVRYTYTQTPDPASLTEGHYTFADATIYVYGNPGSQPTFVSARLNGFLVKECDYVTIDGFTILRTTSQGIQIVGASNTSHSTWITVTNCTSAFNWRHGIYLKWTSNSSVLSNTTHTNVRHGIYLINSDNCQITRNVSYGNEDPAPTRGGIAGIKVGESSVSTDVSDVTVDYNIVRDNEDTGIDLNGAQRILVRRNVSFHNRDHGYDNNATDHTVFLNRLLSEFRNGRGAELIRGA